MRKRRNKKKFANRYLSSNYLFLRVFTLEFKVVERFKVQIF
jgi:hypothetical protein